MFRLHCPRPLVKCPPVPAVAGVMIVALASVTITLPWAARAAEPPKPGPASAATPASAAEPVLVHCLVSLLKEAKVPAREAGVLVELRVREGDAVKAGDVIARIDDSQPNHEKRKAKAEHDQAIAKAESDVDVRFAVASELVAAAEYEKARLASDKLAGSVTLVELDRLELNERKAELQIEQAELERKMTRLGAEAKEVEVDAADSAIERRQVTTPLDGTVVQVFPHEGEWMQPGEPLARVVRTDRLRVEGYVDSARWDPETVRDRPVTVTVTFADSRVESFEGRIVFTSPLVDSGGDYRVWAEVENRRVGDSNQWLLRAGQSATMTIHASRPPLPPVTR